MENKNLEKLIPITMKILEKHKSDLKKETKGHISSFGPSVIMAGLRQTVKSYEDKKNYINEMILEICHAMDWYQEAKSLDAVVANHNVLVKKRILEVVVACKLCIKTFDLKV